VEQLIYEDAEKYFGTGVEKYIGLRYVTFEFCKNDFS
jgi:hypothetical protein